MVGILNYSHLNAKISAMRGKMLSQEDYDQLLHKTSVSEIALYLKDNTYYGPAFQHIQAVDVHRGFLEVMLTRALIMDALKIARYLKGKDKTIYRYVYRKQEIEDLKKMLRTLQMNQPLQTIDRKTLFISKYSKIDFNYSLRAHNISELIETLKGTNFYAILKPLLINDNTIDLYAAEMALDMYYYVKLVDQIHNMLKGKERDIMHELFGTDADIKNILWIYRVKKYYQVNKEMIYRYLIPLSYKLKKEDITRLVEAKDNNDLIAALKETYYKSVIGNDPDKWESDFIKFLIKVHKKNVLKFPYTVAPVIGYIALKEIEISNIITIVEGIRYKVNSDSISEQLIGYKN